MGLFSFKTALAPSSKPPSHTHTHTHTHKHMHIHSFYCKVEEGMLTSFDF